MAMIEAIERVRNQVRLVISDADEIMIPLQLFRLRPLEAGDSIDLEEYEHWLLLHQYRPALERAVALLASRAHSRFEIEQKLQRSGYRPSAIEMVIYKLEKENLLSDEDFAQQWVTSRSNRRLGKRRIAQELKQKGISASTAEAALDACSDESELIAAIDLAQKAAIRKKPDEPSRKTMQRIIGMLVRRGYSWDIAKQAASQALDAMDD